MHRTLIVARIQEGAEPDVARIFAESDRTELPRLAGVARRELYKLGDAYIHLLETHKPPAQAVGEVRQSEEFQRVSERLQPYISPYLPTWKSPQDAFATCFYRWTPEGDIEADA